MNRKNEKQKRSFTKKLLAGMLTLAMLCSVVCLPYVIAAEPETEVSQETDIPDAEETTDEVIDVTVDESADEVIGETVGEEQEEELSEEIEPLAESGTYDAVNYFAASGVSTNGHYNVQGLFVDENKNAYLVIFLDKNDTTQEITDVTVNGSKINSPSVETYTGSVTITLPDGSTKTLTGNHGILVLGIGTLANITEVFTLDVNSKANGWDVTGLPIHVKIEYSITKDVDKSIAEIGEELTYTITVRNDSEIALSGITVTDTVPAEIEIISVDGNTEVIQNGNIVTLETGLALGANGGTKTYTVKARVADTASAGKVINTATIGGDLIPKSDTAEVTIVANNVTVTKIVTGNLGDTAAEFDFTAVVKLNDNIIKLPAPSDGSYTVHEDGTISFTLSNGESVMLTGIPGNAAVIVKEIDAHGYEVTYSCTVNGTTTGISNPENGVTVTDDTEITVTNHKDVIIDTGVSLDFLPYILILAFVAAGAAVFAIGRRYKTF